MNIMKRQAVRLSSRPVWRDPLPYLLERDFSARTSVEMTE